MTDQRLPSWDKAKEFGIDLTLLDVNLRLTPTERLIAHQKALEAALAMRDAGAAYYAGLSKAPQAARRK